MWSKVNRYTRYLDRPFLSLLNAPNAPLEYTQVNLANVDKHTEVFTPPKLWRERDTGWECFDVVYDLTGETAYDKPELVSRLCTQ